jgi:hypothetical protein
VKLVDDERAEDKNEDVFWDERIAHAIRSGRRMELHLLIVRDGNKPRRWMFPQRSNRLVVHEGLIRIDEKVPPDSEGTMEIEELLEANESIVEIH